MRSPFREHGTSHGAHRKQASPVLARRIRSRLPDVYRGDLFTASLAGETVSVSAVSVKLGSGLGWHLIGANRQSRGVPLNRSTVISNYLVGNDPRAWRQNVVRYSMVRFDNLYPGIAVVYYFREGHLEFDLDVSGGANPADVRFAIRGAQKIATCSDGTLKLSETDRVVVLKKPSATQGGSRIDAHYVVEKNAVRIVLAMFDRRRPLVVDPVVIFTAYPGG